MVVCYFVSVLNVLSLSHVLSLLTRGHNSHEPIVEGLNIRLCLCLCLEKILGASLAPGVSRNTVLLLVVPKPVSPHNIC